MTMKILNQAKTIKCERCGKDVFCFDGRQINSMEGFALYVGTHQAMNKTICKDCFQSLMEWFHLPSDYHDALQRVYFKSKVEGMQHDESQF